MIRRLCGFIVLAALMYCVPVAVARLTYKPGPPRLLVLSRAGESDALVVIEGQGVTEFEWRGAAFEPIAKARLPFPPRVTTMLGMPTEAGLERVLFVAHGSRAVLCRFDGGGIRVERLDLPVSGLIHQAMAYTIRSRDWLLLRTYPLSPLQKNQFCVHLFRMAPSSDGKLVFELVGAAFPAKQELLGIRSADLDGDGEREVIASTPGGAFAYQWRGRSLVRKWPDPLPTGDGGDALANLMGDSRARIVTLASVKGGMRLRVYERGSEGFDLVAESKSIPRGSRLRAVRSRWLAGPCFLVAVPESGGGDAVAGYLLLDRSRIVRCPPPVILPRRAPMVVGGFTGANAYTIAYWDGAKPDLAEPAWLRCLEE